MVAPFTGAWIETVKFIDRCLRSMSHPSRVRGLKPSESFTSALAPVSHPSRVRGLKLLYQIVQMERLWSHPSRVRGLKHIDFFVYCRINFVAPFTGAWIETRSPSPFNNLNGLVAPFTGAWIETEERNHGRTCTLKSHPSRVRGLKRLCGYSQRSRRRVAPFTGAWIETPNTCLDSLRRWSHPSRVRGLKPGQVVSE